MVAEQRESEHFKRGECWAEEHPLGHMKFYAFPYTPKHEHFWVTYEGETYCRTCGEIKEQDVKPE